MTDRHGKEITVGVPIAWGPLDLRRAADGRAHVVNRYMGEVVGLLTCGRLKVRRGDGQVVRVSAGVAGRARVLDPLAWAGYQAQGLAAADYGEEVAP